MFVVPVGAVFAFSSVRSNLPGAPTGFGESTKILTMSRWAFTDLLDMYRGDYRLDRIDFSRSLRRGMLTFSLYRSIHNPARTRNHVILRKRSNHYRCLGFLNLLEIIKTERRLAANCVISENRGRKGQASESFRSVGQINCKQD